MTLQQWMLIWKIVLVAELLGRSNGIVYCGYTFRDSSFFDVRRLVRTLHAQHAEQEKAINSK